MSKRVLALIGFLVAISTALQAREGILFGWGDSGRHYPATEKPSLQKAAFSYGAWKGETVNAMALIWSPETLANATVKASALRSGKAVIPAEVIRASFVSYVTGDRLADKYNQCGKRDTVNWEAIREADLIGRYDALDIPVLEYVPADGHPVSSGLK